MRTVLCIVACVVLMVLPVGASSDRAHAGQGAFQMLHVADELPSSAFLPQISSCVASSADSPVNALAPPALLKAKEVLEAIQKRHGDSLPGYVGGRIFHNRERTLPPGRYREYDVNPQIPGRNRGPERLVIEQRTGKAYYTADHYVTFIPMN
jgi:guanyl-specific ribonuclease Sa